MRTLTPATAQTAPALTLEERLTLSSLAMDGRLDQAAVAFEVNTAHMPAKRGEILAAPMSAPARRPDTVADVLREAARLISTHGWRTGYVGNAETGYCLIGAVRAAAGGNRRLEDAAETDLLNRIRSQFPDALSVGAWNDSQPGPPPAIRMLS